MFHTQGWDALWTDWHVWIYRDVLYMWYLDIKCCNSIIIITVLLSLAKIRETYKGQINVRSFKQCALSFCARRQNHRLKRACKQAVKYSAKKTNVLGVFCFSLPKRQGEKLLQASTYKSLYVKVNEMKDDFIVITPELWLFYVPLTIWGLFKTSFGQLVKKKTQNRTG